MIKYGPSPRAVPGRSHPGEASQDLKLTEIDADSSDTVRNLSDTALLYASEVFTW